ncbi:MAG: hypothetical protein DRQ63_01095 [Gammaproteobacteria bacterium]|nr:MAG: hypothetical protein DRQ63_01095 [Gammaproteobacteria bacterium]
MTITDNLIGFIFGPWFFLLLACGYFYAAFKADSENVQISHGKLGIFCFAVAAILWLLSGPES